MLLRIVKAKGKEKMKGKKSIDLGGFLTFQIESQPRSGTYLSKQVLSVFRTFLIL